jgi:hypothetical protein
MLFKNMWWVPVCLLVTGFTSPIQPDKGGTSIKWAVSQNSSLSVNGSTNVNKFSCVIPAYDRTDTLTVSTNKKDQGVNLTGNIGLNISSFDCHNSGMTKQLQKTLNEKQFPLLHIRFLSLNKLPELTVQPKMITGMVNIEIAGVNKRFEIKYQINRDDQKTIHLVGSRVINFSDFNLIPPRKLGGMIKTKDELSVEFHMNIKTI